MTPPADVQKFKLSQFDRFASDLIPNVSYKTLLRWRLHGVRGVRLHAERIGGSWFTTRADVKAFIAAQNARQNSTPAPIVTAAEVAGEELAAAGV